jgi:hypothetical protein
MYGLMDVVDAVDVVDVVDAVDAVGMGSLWDGVYGAWTVLCTPRQSTEYVGGRGVVDW